MKNNFIDEKLKDDERNKVIDIAWEEFISRHPVKSWPKWFSKCVRIDGVKNKECWKVKVKILPKIQLKPNQQWEEKRGVPILVEIDTITGEKSVVICGGPSTDEEVVFEVWVADRSGSKNVIKDCDINLLDGSKYEVCR